MLGGGSDEPMGWGENRLTADDWGVRIGDEDFPYRAFRWGAVTRLRAYAVKDGAAAFEVVEIHHGGDWEEVLTGWEDFPGVAASISAHLPGIRPDWLDLVRGLPVGAGVVTVWERAAEPR
jgi:hypothetical protein